MRNDERVEELQFEFHILHNKLLDLIQSVKYTPMDVKTKESALNELMIVSEHIDSSLTSLRKTLGYIP